MNVIRMRGIPYRAAPEDIRGFFRSCSRTMGVPEVDIVDVSIDMGPDGRPNGDALVEFASGDDCERAMSFDRQMMGNRYVELRRASNHPDPRMGMSQHVIPVAYQKNRDRNDGAYPRADRPDRERPDRPDREWEGGERRRSRSRERIREAPPPKDRRSRSRERDRPPRDRRSGSPARNSSPPPPAKPKKEKKSNWDAPPDVSGGCGDANNPQLTYKARRIYVGNLPTTPVVTDIMLREFLDQAMQQAGLTSGSGCCVSDVWISSEKHFAFVEVRTLQEANNAITHLDGISFYGSPLRINRPADYIPPGGCGLAMPQVGITGLNTAGSTQVNLYNLMTITKKCRRVHVGNLPVGAGVTPSILRQFISQLMQQLQLVVKPGDPVVDAFVSSDGKFGFVEMRTIAEANNALSMMGVDFMGRPLRVGRPADYLPPTPDVIIQCEGTGILGTPGDFGVTMSLPGVTVAGPPEPDLSTATRVVVLTNMLTDTELESHEECQEIAADTIGKCEEDFGRVLRLIIARPGRDGLPPDAERKVFVEFESLEDAKKAATGLHRVKFDDRVVAADFVRDEGLLDHLASLYPEQNRGN